MSDVNVKDFFFGGYVNVKEVEEEKEEKEK